MQISDLNDRAYLDYSWRRMASLVAMYKLFDLGHMRVTKRTGPYKHLHIY